MEQFNLYVHGVPVGHEICGCDEELDYIKGFYNHDVKVEVSSLLQIDVVNGKSFYTYLRKKNVRNAEGRPGSYFGLTVSFSEKYCTNIQMLYEILDVIYKQLCVDSLIKPGTDGDRFLVKQISTSLYRNHPIVDYIKAAFKNNLESLRFDVLKGFVNSSSEARFSLKEVDSPLFRETLKNKRILVSPEYGTASAAYSNLLKEVEPIRTANVQLKLTNTRLTESNEYLSNEVARLEKELTEFNVSVSKKYKVQLDELQAQLETCKQEKKKLDAKIKEATSTVDLIDEPFKKLTRLLAGRFQEMDDKVGQKPSKNRSTNRAVHMETPWLQIGSIILLLAVISLCGYCSYTVLQLSESVTTIQETIANGKPDYDNYECCNIDISPSPDETNKIQKGKTYILSVMNGNRIANVPTGTWEGTSGITITRDTLKADTTSINVEIYYTVNGEHKIKRTIQVN